MSWLAQWHARLVLAEFALAAVTLLALLRVRAPYGRHARAGWGPTLSQRLAWVLMEAPAVLLWGAIFATGVYATEGVSVFFCALWMTHYVHRTFVYPLRIKPGAKRTPWLVVLLAIGFNTLNALVNAGQASHVRHYEASWWLDARMVLGCLLFALGFAINQHADWVLARLRGPGERGYKIPYGGLYRWVSCPNYLGEMCEWLGWATATWSLGGLAFAVYSAANLVPRALDHHRWYREQFADYPPERHAVIPWLL
ncbi:MAG: DUF1295 domain-containing protein [Deltaproteobacteria bacterium]|nr:DUF1295 domain-containing protein [Deltaproteobacteria bacterium]